ncbi:MAG: serine/threonine-protein kinase [Pseudomonadota bacterium]
MNQMLAGEDLADATEGVVGSELLKGQYVIQSKLQSGGFGITYVARDSLARQVVIKECFPAGICVRRGGLIQPKLPEFQLQFSAIKTQFVREARQLAKLVHPNIVAVHQVFEENNTAYMALDKIEGCDLVSLVERRTERISNEFLNSVLEQSLAALTFIHDKGLLHRDISPDNMMIDQSGHLTLIDFGAAREWEGVTQSTVIAVKDGYSPHELYSPDGVHDFSSDLYSLGATLYYLLTGTPPIDCHTRLHATHKGQRDPYEPLSGRQIAPSIRFDERILSSIDRAMAFSQNDRFRFASEWVAALGAASSSDTAARGVVLSGAELENEIAHIVEATNAQLTPAEEEAAKRAAENLEAAEMAWANEKKAKQVVDLFGNPIEDVTVWLKEQELEIEAREARRKAEEAAAEAAARAAAQPASPEDETADQENTGGTGSDVEQVIDAVSAPVTATSAHSTEDSDSAKTSSARHLETQTDDGQEAAASDTSGSASPTSGGNSGQTPRPGIFGRWFGRRASTKPNQMNP